MLLLFIILAILVFGLGAVLKAALLGVVVAAALVLVGVLLNNNK